MQGRGHLRGLLPVPDFRNGLYNNVDPSPWAARPEYDDGMSLLWLGDIMWRQWRDSADVIKIQNKLILNSSKWDYLLWAWLNQVKALKRGTGLSLWMKVLSAGRVGWELTWRRLCGRGPQMASTGLCQQPDWAWSGFFTCQAFGWHCSPT